MKRIDQGSKNRTKQRRDSQPIRCRIQNTGNRMLTEMVEYGNKTGVIRVLTEMVEYGFKIEEKVKAMKSEIKENAQGTNSFPSQGKETGTQVNNLEQKEEINIQPEQNKETIQKNEERLRNLWDNFKCSNI